VMHMRPIFYLLNLTATVAFDQRRRHAASACGGRGRACPLPRAGGADRFRRLPRSGNGMVRPCSCPASKGSWQGAPKPRSTPWYCYAFTNSRSRSPHSRMRWHLWVVLIAGTTGSALGAVRPPNFHMPPGDRRYPPVSFDGSRRVIGHGMLCDLSSLKGRPGPPVPSTAGTKGRKP
jgi:hypothetical protein